MLGLRHYKALVLAAAMLLSTMGCVTFVSTNCQSTVYVTGSITSNTIWLAANSPYVLTGYVTVASGVTLTIEPGVEVRFGSGCELLVYGSVNATGTALNRITFTADATDLSEFYIGVGGWIGIRVLGAGTFSYCDVEWAYQGITLDSDGNTVTDCMFSDRSMLGIMSGSGSNDIYWNDFYGGGISFDPYESKASMLSNYLAGNSVNGRPVLLYANTIVSSVPTDVGQLIAINCTDSVFRDLEVNDTCIGIQVYYCDNATVANCTVTGCYYGMKCGSLEGCSIADCNASDNIAYGIEVFSSNLVNITGNTIEGNGNSGLYLASWGTDFRVTGNTFADNTCSGLMIHDWYGSEFYLENNTFAGDGIYFYAGTAIYSTLHATNNTVNGRPIFVAQDETSGTVPAGVGQIILLNCSNMDASGSNLSNVYKHATILHCSNITVSDTEMAGNWLSEVDIMYSDNVTVRDCRISGMHERMFIDYSDDFSLIDSSFSGINMYTGSVYSWHSEDGTISGCAFSQCDLGISNSTGWEVSGSTFVASPIQITEQAEGNAIFNCNFTRSSMGIFTSYCTGNLAYHNNFLNMSDMWGEYWEITDASGGNAWDAGYPLGGNYYESRECLDEYSDALQDVPGWDGIGDQPVQITDPWYDSGVVAEDRYPLAHPYAWWGDVAPTVELVSPGNGSAIKPATDIALSVWDGNMDLEGATFSANGAISAAFGETFTVDTGGWQDGAVSLTVEAEDQTGHKSTRIFEFVVDSTPPAVASTYPAANQTNVSLGIVLYVNFTEPVNISTYSCEISYAMVSAIEWSEGNRSVANFLNENLACNMVYNASIRAGLADPVGNMAPANYSWSFSTPVDTDMDGTPDYLDDDDDNDGWYDYQDEFPLDMFEWADADGDGTGDNGDSDDDNDGVDDYEDDFPLNPDESLDTDGDYIGNNADTDDDGDGVLDGDDTFPLDPDEWLDTDGDSTGNNADDDDDGDGVLDGEDFDSLDPEVTEDPDAQTPVGTYWWVIVILAVAIIAGVAAYLMRRRQPPVPESEARPLPPPPPEDGPKEG